MLDVIYGANFTNMAIFKVLVINTFKGNELYSSGAYRSCFELSGKLASGLHRDLLLQHISE